ncbi:MAG TPA: hypothetical protein VNS55_00255 [Nocardioides sp.]|nr:hypothetical protein [Nocardioides sp.]
MVGSASPVRERSPAPLDGGATRSRVRTGGAVAGLGLATLVAAAAWLPFLHHPLTSDEAGFLLLGRHWSQGSSLYGDYWVDRPPLLIGLFSIAGHGAATATTAGVVAPSVKLLGAAASGAAVLLTGVLAALLAPDARWARRAAVVVAVALLSSPLLGMPETDGEVLAVPLVLLGLVCLAAALRRSVDKQALVLAAVSGAAAMSAALVKQNVVDVFVFAVVALVLARRRVARPWVRAAAFATGSLGALAVVVGAAATRGTSPAELWDAIVVFRLQASAVIGSSASSATPQRMSELGAAFVVSGAALLLVVTAVVALAGAAGRRRQAWASSAPQSVARDLTWPTLAMVAWELCGVVLGGSYWLHYLTGLVPGLVLLLVLVRVRHRWAVVVAGCVGYAVLACAVAWTQLATAPVAVSSDAEVATYLRDHAAPADGVVVAFGHPGIVAASGLTSPYEHLWSLPVRVRDPRLGELQAVLSGPRAPRWVVVAGDALDSWGLDAAAADRYLRQHYVDEATFGGWGVWERLP